MIQSDNSSLLCSGTYPPPGQVRSSLEQGMYFLSMAKETEMVLVMQEYRCTFCQIVRDGTVLPPRIYHGLQTCYCKEIWGKTGRKGFVETGWKWRSMQRSCRHQPSSTCGCIFQCSPTPCAELVWAASLWVSLRTPCHTLTKLLSHQSRAWHKSSQLDTPLPSSWHVGHPAECVPGSRFPPSRQKDRRIFTGLVPSAQGMGKQS